VAITDETDRLVDEIMEKQHFKNRADCVAWLIEEGYAKLFKEMKA